MNAQMPADVVSNAPRRRRLASFIRPRVARWCAFAVIVSAVVAVIAALLTAANQGVSHNLVAWAAPAMAVAVGLFTNAGIFPLPPRDALDEAWLEGNDLLLRRGDQSVRLPLANVDSVDFDQARALVVLGIKTPCILGSLLRFRTRPRMARSICADLRQRIRHLSTQSE